jgi:hypothetical protein
VHFCFLKVLKCKFWPKRFNQIDLSWFVDDVQVEGANVTDKMADDKFVQTLSYDPGTFGLL